MIIWGAGQAGLLAANALRSLKPVVWERQSSLPENHRALLRFRSDKVAQTLGIPFSKVEVHKGVVFPNNRNLSLFALNNMYALKVTGQAAPRSMLNLEPGARWIAPENLVELMADSCTVEFNRVVTSLDVMSRSSDSTPVISTLPMPLMMDLCSWEPSCSFGHRKVWSVRATLDRCNVHQTLYYPAPEEAVYRASIVGDKIIVESMQEPHNPEALLGRVLEDFGLESIRPINVEVFGQKYGKISISDPQEAKRFVLFLTDKYRIYSLGRFATWRPLLLDDLVNDINTIRAMIEERSGYEQAKRRL